MVRLLDLDSGSDAHDPTLALAPPYRALSSPSLRLAAPAHDGPDTAPRSAGIYSITSYYPVVSELATCLDLTSLDHLSMTCRQVRQNLLQHRATLRHLTLRCANDGLGRQRFPCARDLVCACQRCGVVVCRNCIVKTPPLHTRHRRLCPTCLHAPLPATSAPCTCPETAWSCLPCARARRADDMQYMRGWTWRRRYSRAGTAGAGLGEGEQGVPCALGDGCLAARAVEVEIDAAAEGDDGGTAGYRTQEMEGIGGVVKKKVRKRVGVGRVVEEFEEEREAGDYLRREREGLVRSWCAHCGRVVAGPGDGGGGSEGG